MRRVIMMEGDVGEDSTPLLDTFQEIAQGQTKITVAQVKVCSTFRTSYLALHTHTHSRSRGILTICMHSCYDCGLELHRHMFCWCSAKELVYQLVDKLVQQVSTEASTQN